MYRCQVILSLHTGDDKKRAPFYSALL